MKKPGDLTLKQQRFVAEYLKDLNAKQAAIRTGYSAKTAEVQGCQLLRIPKIAAAVKEATGRQLERAELTAARTLEEMRRIAFFDVRSLFNEKGRLRPLHELSAEEAACVSSLEVIVKNAEAGDKHTDIVHKLKTWDKIRVLEMLGKYFKLLTEQIEIKGDWDKRAARLASARLREKKIDKK